MSRKAKHRKRSQGQQEGGPGTAIGALMDGIPESVAIEVSVIGGGVVSAAMVAAVFLSIVAEVLSDSRARQRMKGNRCQITDYHSN